MRRALAKLGLLAAAMLLLQPACFAYELAHSADALCCAQIQADSAAPPVDSAKAQEAAKDVLPPVAPALRSALAPPPVRLASWSSPPPPSLPYYARTARILR